MYELAHHPEDQTRIRNEVNAKRAKFSANGQDDFTITDLETLPFTNACIKVGNNNHTHWMSLTVYSQEVLRFHPISPWVTRESAIDDVIPLAEPIMTTSGELVSQIEIASGTPVLVSTCAYNRSVVYLKYFSMRP